MSASFPSDLSSLTGALAASATPLASALKDLVSSSPEALRRLISSAAPQPLMLFGAATLFAVSFASRRKEVRDQAAADDTSIRNPHAPPALIRLLKNGRRKLLSDVLDVGAFFGLDIGGSLAKLIFFFPDSGLTQSLLERGRSDGQLERREDWGNKLTALANINQFIQSQEAYGATGKREPGLAFHSEELGGAFHFIHFETRRMKGAFTLARDNGLTWGMSRLCATGGGAHRFLSLARDLLGVELDSRDEIDCLVKGMAFLIGYVRGEAYTFIGRHLVDRPMEQGVEYPFLLANIGSGVGYILVKSETEWQRVSGTSIGGGTFYGLCSATTGLSSFDDMLDLAEEGDNTKADLTVGDIYGGDYNRFGLKSTTIASSFGKALLHTVPPAATATTAASSSSTSGASIAHQPHQQLQYKDPHASAAAAAGGSAVALSNPPSATSSREQSPGSPARQQQLNRGGKPSNQQQGRRTRGVSASSCSSTAEARAREQVQSLVLEDAGSFGRVAIGGKATRRTKVSRLPSEPEAEHDHDAAGPLSLPSSEPLASAKSGSGSRSRGVGGSVADFFVSLKQQPNAMIRRAGAAIAAAGVAMVSAGSSEELKPHSHSHSNSSPAAALGSGSGSSAAAAVSATPLAPSSRPLRVVYRGDVLQAGSSNSNSASHHRSSSSGSRSSNANRVRAGTGTGAGAGAALGRQREGEFAEAARTAQDGEEEEEEEEEEDSGSVLTASTSGYSSTTASTATSRSSHGAGRGSVGVVAAVKTGYLEGARGTQEGGLMELDPTLNKSLLNEGEANNDDSGLEAGNEEAHGKEAEDGEGEEDVFSPLDEQFRPSQRNGNGVERTTHFIRAGASSATGRSGGGGSPSAGAGAGGFVTPTTAITASESPFWASSASVSAPTYNAGATITVQQQQQQHRHSSSQRRGHHHHHQLSVSDGATNATQSTHNTSTTTTTTTTNTTATSTSSSPPLAALAPSEHDRSLLRAPAAVPAARAGTTGFSLRVGPKQQQQQRPGSGGGKHRKTPQAVGPERSLGTSAAPGSPAALSVANLSSPAMSAMGSSVSAASMGLMQQQQQMLLPPSQYQDDNASSSTGKERTAAPGSNGTAVSVSRTGELSRSSAAAAHSSAFSRAKPIPVLAPPTASSSAASGESEAIGNGDHHGDDSRVALASISRNKQPQQQPQQQLQQQQQPPRSSSRASSTNSTINSGGSNSALLARMREGFASLTGALGRAAKLGRAKHQLSALAAGGKDTGSLGSQEESPPAASSKAASASRPLLISSSPLTVPAAAASSGAGQRSGSVRRGAVRVGGTSTLPTVYSGDRLVEHHLSSSAGEDVDADAEVEDDNHVLSDHVYLDVVGVSAHYGTYDGEEQDLELELAQEEEEEQEAPGRLMASSTGLLFGQEHPKASPTTQHRRTHKHKSSDASSQASAAAKRHAAAGAPAVAGNVSKPSHSSGGGHSRSSSSSSRRAAKEAQARLASHQWPAGTTREQAAAAARSLLIMISNNIGQLAYLNAVRYQCKHVYFAGNFLRHDNTIAMRCLSYAIGYWSGGSMEGKFLRHEGYCGALGAFLSTLEAHNTSPSEAGEGAARGSE